MQSQSRRLTNQSQPNHFDLAPGAVVGKLRAMCAASSSVLISLNSSHSDHSHLAGGLRTSSTGQSSKLTSICISLPASNSRHHMQPGFQSPCQSAPNWSLSCLEACPGCVISTRHSHRATIVQGNTTNVSSGTQNLASDWLWAAS